MLWVLQTKVHEATAEWPVAAALTLKRLFAESLVA